MSDGLRRLAVWVLCGSAALAIVLVLSGEDIDDTAWRAILTAVAVALYSLTAAAGAGLRQGRPDVAWLGWLQIGVSAAAVLVALPTIWIEDPDEGPIKLAYYLLIAALAGGHASIILRSQAPSDPPALSTVRAGTLLALALLAGLGIAAVSREDAGEPRILVVLAILYLLGSALIPILRRSSPVAPGQVPALDHLVIAVSDWERSNSFYREVLGAEVVELPRGRAGYRIGDVLLSAYGPGSAPTLAPAKPVEPGGSDLCFRWPRSAEDAIRHVRERGVEIAAGPVTRVGSGGPGTSVYFTDPDGSLIELISYDSASPESSSKSSAQELMQ